MNVISIYWESGTTTLNKKYVPQSNAAEELIINDGQYHMINSSDRWFWEYDWQEGEKRVDEHIRKGEYEEFASMEEFLSTLGD